jgi:NAD(P)H-dependent flavin oxidoreductase YrpB (nitropropane dioxygenase family)
MSQTVFKSQYPILEACMNRGSTLELAVAVHQAGGYPSLCSWTYNRRNQLMQQDLDCFVKQTQSNRIHLSFELDEFDNHAVHDIVKSHSIPTIELIYGKPNSPNGKESESDPALEKRLLHLIEPLKAQGTRIFKRMYDTVDQATMDRHLLDGFCIKGLESAGYGTFVPVRETFLRQRELTPGAMLIPYGGIGTAEQVQDYIELGAEMIAVGTVLALSTESTMSKKTKLAAIQKKSQDLVYHPRNFGEIERKQSALIFGNYSRSDDEDGTIGLVRGLHGKTDSQVYFGHGIDHVTEILPCREIIQRLVAKI